jgi:hydrogenase maturation protease
MTAPVLVFGYGNPSRGDDALGPEFVRRLEHRFAVQIALGELEVLTDYQLQVEHALDLVGREHVYFVDATAAVGAPAFELQPVSASRDASFTTHLLTPQALLHTFAQVESGPAPQVSLLAIRGERFELGEAMSALAEQNVSAALQAFVSLSGLDERAPVVAAGK